MLVNRYALFTGLSERFFLLTPYNGYIPIPAPIPFKRKEYGQPVSVKANNRLTSNRRLAACLKTDPFLDGLLGKLLITS